MNTKQFKSLIKEAVKEVIQEELSAILKEAVLSNRQTQTLFVESTPAPNPQINSNEMRNKLNNMYGFGTPPKPSTPASNNINEVKNNPIMNLLAETAMEFTPMDRANLTRLD